MVGQCGEKWTARERERVRERMRETEKVELRGSVLREKNMLAGQTTVTVFKILINGINMSLTRSSRSVDMYAWK